MQTSKNKNYPSFSLIIEIENLSVVGFDELEKCLKSLANQTFSPQNANEVLLLDNSDSSAEKVQILCREFPWITIQKISPDLGYYETKMEGFRRSTGDIIVYTDSDCTNQDTWLESLLSVFVRHPEKQIVAGEAAVKINGPYGLATSLTWNFPVFSNKEKIYRHTNYLMNNVAFRREVLADCPIRENLPIYRGNCAIHCVELRSKGYEIWKQPAAKVYHPLPANTFWETVWRWFLHGHDKLKWYRIIDKENLSRRKWLHPVQRDLESFLRLLSECTYKPTKRLPLTLKDNFSRILYLPLTIPIIIFFFLLSVTGYIVGLFIPEKALRFAKAKISEIGAER